MIRDALRGDAGARGSSSNLVDSPNRLLPPLPVELMLLPPLLLLLVFSRMAAKESRGAPFLFAHSSSARALASPIVSTLDSSTTQASLLSRLLDDDSLDLNGHSIADAFVQNSVTTAALCGSTQQASTSGDS